MTLLLVWLVLKSRKTIIRLLFLLADFFFESFFFFVVHVVVVTCMYRWAEGMAIEPSDVFQRGFLERIRDIKEDIQRNGCNLSE